MLTNKVHSSTEVKEDQNIIECQQNTKVISSSFIHNWIYRIRNNDSSWKEIWPTTVLRASRQDISKICKVSIQGIQSRSFSQEDFSVLRDLKEIETNFSLKTIINSIVSEIQLIHHFDTVEMARQFAFCTMEEVSEKDKELAAFVQGKIAKKFSDKNHLLDSFT